MPSHGNYSNHFVPRRPEKNQAAIVALLKQGVTRPHDIAVIIGYPKDKRGEPGSTFWKDWRAVNGAKWSHTNDSVQVKQIPEPVNIAQIHPSDPRYPCVQDTPEGFRAFFNSYAQEDKPPDWIKGLQEHSFEIVKAAFDYGGQDATVSPSQAQDDHQGNSDRRSADDPDMGSTATGAGQSSPGRWKDQVLINIPPGFAKSEVWSIWFVIWRFVLDRNVRIILLSKTELLAKDFVREIRAQLTTNQKLLQDFGRFRPEGDAVWAAQELDIAGRNSMKERSLRARGTKQQIRGMRCEILIADDTIDDEDAYSEVERTKTENWFVGDALSRVSPLEGGHCFVIGTRVHDDDLFGRLAAKEWQPDPDNPDTARMWEHVTFPALRDPVTGRASAQDDAVSLWPARFSIKKLRKLRETHPGVFSCTYQQEPGLSADLLFPLDALDRCKNNDRRIGEAPWPREEVVRVVTYDPGLANWGAMMLLDVMRPADEYVAAVIDIFRKRGLSPQDAENRLFEWHSEYGPVNFFIPEKNSYYWFDRDPVKMKCLKSGIRFATHFTNQNLHSTEAGLKALADDVVAGRIDLPYSHDRDTRLKTDDFIKEARALPRDFSNRDRKDQVMCLWFPKWHFKDLYVIKPSQTKGVGWKREPWQRAAGW